MLKAFLEPLFRCATVPLGQTVDEQEIGHLCSTLMARGLGGEVEEDHKAACNAKLKAEIILNSTHKHATTQQQTGINRHRLSRAYLIALALNLKVAV